MKKHLLKTILLLFALVAGSTSSWAADELFYTLTPAEGSNNSYAGNCDVTINGIMWNLTGNSKMNPWRIGGKSLTEVDRALYSKTAISDNVTKIEVTHGEASDITVNSWTVIVSTDADFNNIVSTLTPSFEASTTTTINRPDGKGWTNCYYKFIYNVTVSGKNNKFVEFSSADFYKEGGSSTVATPTFSPVAGAVVAGTKVSINCSTDGAAIHYTTDGSDPTSSSATYSTPIVINEAQTIKAIAVKDGLTNSDVATAEYTIAAPSAPTFSVDEGEVIAGTTVTITGTGTIRYTTNGDDPTSSTGTVYSEPVSIDASCTLKAICVDGGGNASDVTSATYTVLTPVAGYTIDFESQLSQYTDWKVTNAEVATNGDNANISAHGGTHYGTTGGKTSASIQTKAKVANPRTFTCYVSKQTNNTTSSTWYIQVSEDGSEWTDVETKSATSMSAGEWKEFMADLTSYSNVFVRLYYSGSTAVRNVDDIVLTEVTPSSVPTPTFSVAAGTYTEAQNVKVSNYNSDYMYFYTTDGTTPDCDGSLDPTGTSVAYNHTTGIVISETTTLKIIAVDGDVNKSNVADATYKLPLTTIAEVKALTSGDNFTLNLTGAQIVYFDGGKNMYIRDASGAILFYNSSSFSTELETGDILSGIVTGTYKPYNNLPEVINSDISALSKTGNSTVVAKTIAGTTEAIAANLCDLVKIENTEISESDSKYYVGTSSDIQLWNQFKIDGLTFTTGQPVDVSGIATVYNTTYELFPRFESDIVYLSSAEEVAIGAAGIATFCSEHALDFTGTDAIAVYTAAASGDHVTLTQIHKVPANTGVILMNAQGMNEGAVAAVNVPYLDGDADDVSDNELVGITTATVVNATVDGKYNYILSNEDAGVGFYKAVNGVQLAANKAYLSTTVNAAVRGFLGFTEDDSDAIIEIAKNEKMSAIYDLSGRRVVKPTKGLYIVNGKKVVK